MINAMVDIEAPAREPEMDAVLEVGVIRNEMATPSMDENRTSVSAESREGACCQVDRYRRHYFTICLLLNMVMLVLFCFSVYSIAAGVSHNNDTTFTLGVILLIPSVFGLAGTTIFCNLLGQNVNIVEDGVDSLNSGSVVGMRYESPLPRYSELSFRSNRSSGTSQSSEPPSYDAELCSATLFPYRSFTSGNGITILPTISEHFPDRTNSLGANDRVPSYNTAIRTCSVKASNNENGAISGSDEMRINMENNTVNSHVNNSDCNSEPYDADIRRATFHLPRTITEVTTNSTVDAEIGSLDIHVALCAQSTRL